MQCPLWTSVVFNIQQREKRKKKNFEELKLKDIKFCIRHLECQSTSSNKSNVCLQPLQNYSRHYSLTNLIWTITSSNRAIESTPEIITLSDVIWRHVCFNIMKTDDAQVTWLVRWLDVILGANAVLFSFWLPPEWMKLSIYSGRKLQFWSALIQFGSDFNRYVNSLQLFSGKDRSNPAQNSLSSNC